MNEDSIYFNAIDDTEFGEILRLRRNEAEEGWKKDDLKTVREANNKMYLGTYIEEQLVDERYQELFADNRQFTSVRTILPFLAARVTAAEVTPSDGRDISVQFAKDFEEALQKGIEKQHGRGKVRLAIQDLLRGERVGILKIRYDAVKDIVLLEWVKPGTVTIGKRASLFEEPDYLSQEIKKTIGDLLTMFPDKAAVIKKLFGLPENPSIAELDKVKTIREEWIWLTVNGKRELLVGWSWQNTVFGKIKDPNWKENGKNVSDCQMMPYIFFNFLNDGTSHIDQTSFIEQAKWLQKNYNKRGQTIAENARYGGTGVPIFAKDAIGQKDVAKIRFSPIQRVLLDATDVSKAFTVWQSTPLPNYIVDDKVDLRDSIDNVWASNAVLRGQQTNNDTLGQDILNRDQAEGRLSDPIDCIDDSMTRLYQLYAQLMYRNYDKDKFINFLGNDGKFVSIVVSSEEISKNLGIQISVKAGTSLPIDRAQRRATIMELMKLGKVGTLTAYKELNIFDDPEAAYKEYILETVDPASSLAEVDKKVFSREASQDLYLVIAGETPEEREDIEDDYLQFLNDWLLTDKYMLLQEKNPDAAARVSAFVDSIVEKASRKVNKMALQPAAPDEVPPEVQAEMDAAAQQQAVSGEAPVPTQPPVVQ